MTLCEPCLGTGHQLAGVRPVRFWRCSVCAGLGTLWRFMGYQPCPPAPIAWRAAH